MILQMPEKHASFMSFKEEAPLQFSQTVLSLYSCCFCLTPQLPFTLYALAKLRDAAVEVALIQGLLNFP
jgi:hypothetical protein